MIRDRTAQAQVELPEIQLPEPPPLPALQFVKLTVGQQTYIALPVEQGVLLRDFLYRYRAYHEKVALRFGLLKEQNEQLRRLYR